jgi:hypothetical protein
MLRGEGFYRIAYTGAGGGSGFGLPAFETGRVYGVDAMGILYLGDYSLDQITLKAIIELTIPPGVWLVTGQPAAPAERKITIEIQAPRAGGVQHFSDDARPHQRCVREDRRLSQLDCKLAG